MPVLPLAVAVSQVPRRPRTQPLSEAVQRRTITPVPTALGVPGACSAENRTTKLSSVAQRPITDTVRGAKANDSESFVTRSESTRNSSCSRAPSCRASVRCVQGVGPVRSIAPESTTLLSVAAARKSHHVRSASAWQGGADRPLFAQERTAAHRAAVIAALNVNDLIACSSAPARLRPSIPRLRSCAVPPQLLRRMTRRRPRRHPSVDSAQDRS